MPDIWMDVDAALSEVPVNIFPLLDDTTFKDIEADVNYNAAGLALIWHFVTTAGAYTQTAVTPTDTGGNYDWVEQGNGMFTIEIPATGGASINNDTEGFGWFTGLATGVLPWRGPVIGFRAAGLNNSLVDGTTIDVNATAISGDTTAADNCELMFDGTGYAGGTTKLGVDAATIGGGTIAAFLDDIWEYAVTLGAETYDLIDVFLAALCVMGVGASHKGTGTHGYWSPDDTELIVSASVDAQGQRSDMWFRGIS